MTPSAQSGGAPPPQLALGTAYAVLAVSIWVGWILLTRLGVTTQMNAWDIAALRFGTAAVILSPILWRRGLGLTQAGPANIAIMVCCAGAPYVVVANLGLTFAPAAHAAALMPGVMPLTVAVLAYFLLGEAPSPARYFGYGGILAGVLLVGGSQIVLGASQSRLFGDGLFLTASTMWACFTITSRRARLDPIHSTAIIAVMSAVIYLPAYAISGVSHLAQSSWADILTQAGFQGIMVSIVSLLAYQRAIQLIGPARSSTFGALVPVTVLVSAIPSLGEIPSWTDSIGIILISLGVFLASRR